MLTLDLSGKKALVMGVTNQRSLGYAIAEKLHQAGAELAFSYQGERLREEVERLAEEFLQRVVAQDAAREGVLEEVAE